MTCEPMVQLHLLFFYFSYKLLHFAAKVRNFCYTVTKEKQDYMQKKRRESKKERRRRIIESG